MKIAIKNGFVILAFFVSGCLGSAHYEKIMGRYNLFAIDLIEDMSLGYEFCDQKGDYYYIVGPTVFSIGYNNKFIIVKQHPFDENTNTINRNIVNYFIVPVHNDTTQSPKVGVIGPLTIVEFNAKRKELNIPDSVTFTKEIEELK